MCTERNVLLAGLKHANGESKKAYGILLAEQHRLDSPEHALAVSRRLRQEVAEHQLNVDEEYSSAVMETMVSVSNVQNSP